MLITLVLKYGKDFNTIAKLLERDVTEVFSRWIDMQMQPKEKTIWTKSEDDKLAEAVNEVGERAWDEVTLAIKTKNRKQCEERWKSLKKLFHHKKWTSEQDK